VGLTEGPGQQWPDIRLRSGERQPPSDSRCAISMECGGQTLLSEASGLRALASAGSTTRSSHCAASQALAQ